MIEKTVKTRTAPTMRDVAQASGVSSTTVSFVLNNTGAVGPRTRERVMRAARQLNYHPSALARGLMYKRMNTLGIVFAIPDPAPISNPYFAPILDGIIAAAAEHKQITMLFAGQVWSDAEHSLPFFCDGRCDGLLLIGPHTHSDIVPSLIQSNMPFALINNRWEEGPVSYVDVDDVASAITLTTHLLQQGHRRIAMLRGLTDVGCVLRRQEGYRQALGAAGISYDPSLDVEGAFLEPGVADGLRALLSSPCAKWPTALICSTDSIALQALDDLAAMGIHVPEDLSVVGFDDIAPSGFSRPPLTTMRQPFPLLGLKAVKLLLAQIEGHGFNGQHELLSTELVVRQSVKNMHC